jgi:RNA polymerase sigma-70 factor (ECF subfamily)
VEAVLPPQTIKNAQMDAKQQLTTQFLANRHSLYAFIYGFVRHPHDAEDIFQEVWLRFADAVAKEIPMDDPSAWCRGVARNLIRHYWRDRQADKVVVDDELVTLVEMAFAEQPPTQDAGMARQQALGECVQELPERSRKLLRLKYEQGLTAEGVAEKMAQSAAGILMALSRLRRALRDCTAKKLRLQGLEP